MRTPAFLIGKAAENPLWGEENAVWEEVHAWGLGTWVPGATGLDKPNGATPGDGPDPGLGWHWALGTGHHEYHGLGQK